MVWDDKIPDEFLYHWQAWLQELPKLEQVTNDRCFKSLDLGEITSVSFTSSPMRHSRVTERSHTSESQVMMEMSSARLLWENPDSHLSNQSQFPDWSYQQLS